MTALAPGTTKAFIRADYMNEDYYEHSLEGFFEVIVKTVREAIAGDDDPDKPAAWYNEAIRFHGSSRQRHFL